VRPTQLRLNDVAQVSAAFNLLDDSPSLFGGMFSILHVVRGWTASQTNVEPDPQCVTAARSARKSGLARRRCRLRPTTALMSYPRALFRQQLMSRCVGSLWWNSASWRTACCCRIRPHATRVPPYSVSVHKSLYVYCICCTSLFVESRQRT